MAKSCVSCMHDVCKQHIRANKLSDHFDFSPSFAELKMDEVTKLKWMDFSNDCQTTPRMKSYTQVSPPASSALPVDVIRAEAADNLVQIVCGSSRGRMHACVACGRGSHVSFGQL